MLLKIAKEGGPIEALYYLLQRDDVDVNYLFTPGEIPALYYAIKKGHKDIEQLLLSYGANKLTKEDYERLAEVEENLARAAAVNQRFRYLDLGQNRQGYVTTFPSYHMEFPTNSDE